MLTNTGGAAVPEPDKNRTDPQHCKQDIMLIIPEEQLANFLKLY
jgi:hypothetical protein